MFEHFGLKDVFYGLWKYKWRMLVCALLISMLATLISLLFPVKTEAPQIETGGQEELQTSERYFYFDYSGSDPSLSSEVMAQMYLSTVNKQVCKDFIVDYVLGLITKEDIVAYMNGAVTETQITTNFFTQYVNVSVDSTDVGITLLCRTPNREFSDILCNAYTAWFESLIKDNVQVNLVVVSDNKDVMLVENAKTTTISEKTNRSAIQIFFITFVLAILAECIVVFFIILFKPTLNRRTDYEQIGLNVLGKYKLSRKE